MHKDWNKDKTEINFNVKWKSNVCNDHDDIYFFFRENNRFIFKHKFMKNNPIMYIFKCKIKH